jgi:hypothetical protein
MAQSSLQSGAKKDPFVPENAMQSSAARIVIAVLVAASGIYAGIRMGAYAERDDAPGGVVIAALLILSSAALGLWIAMRKPGRPSANGG